MAKGGTRDRDDEADSERRQWMSKRFFSGVRITTSLDSALPGSEAGIHFKFSQIQPVNVYIVRSVLPDQPRMRSGS